MRFRLGLNDLTPALFITASKAAALFVMIPRIRQLLDQVSKNRILSSAIKKLHLIRPTCVKVMTTHFQMRWSWGLCIRQPDGSNVGESVWLCWSQASGELHHGRRGESFVDLFRSGRETLSEYFYLFKVLMLMII
jgi:hypothetical protein